MTLLEPTHVLGALPSFVCADLGELYAARDRAAALAAPAFERDDAKPLVELQALLRAPAAVALVNELPTAVFVESGLLWRAKLNACRRLLASQGDAARDPFGGLTFDLFAYSVAEFQDVLVAAAALPLFKADARSHFAAVLAVARELGVPALKEWSTSTSPAMLHTRLEKLLAGGSWAAAPPAPTPAVDRVAAATRPPASPAAATVISSGSASKPEAEPDLVGLAAAVKGSLGYYSYPAGTAFHELVRSDPIARKFVMARQGEKAILVLKSVLDDMAGQPCPDPKHAPVAAVVYAARAESR